MENYSSRIEFLLRELSPEILGLRAVIAQNPYEAIEGVLLGRISIKLLKNFQMKYQAINNKSLSFLIEDDYDFEILISYLSNIVKLTKENV